MYALSYSDSGKKGERLRMTFDGGAVTDVSIIPDKIAQRPHRSGDQGTARRRSSIR